MEVVELEQAPEQDQGSCYASGLSAILSDDE